MPLRKLISAQTSTKSDPRIGSILKFVPASNQMYSVYYVSLSLQCVSTRVALVAAFSPCARAHLIQLPAKNVIIGLKRKGHLVYVDKYTVENGLPTPLKIPRCKTAAKLLKLKGARLCKDQLQQTSLSVFL